MKFMTTIALLMAGMTAFAADNLPDKQDENLAPEAQEERLYEPVNRRDPADINAVPAEQEERQEKEYFDSNSDVIDQDAIDDEVRD